MAITGGEIFVKSLISLGGEVGFLVPGESYLGALNAFYDADKEFRLITCRQEGGACYMAEAYAKATGKPGICFVTRGPGASNAMVGIHTSYQDSTPMLLFVGQVATNHQGREAFQELDYAQVFSAVSKAVYCLDSIARIPEILMKAWATAQSGRPGPVVVVMPEDILMDTISTAPRIAIPPHIAQPAADDASLKKIATLLKTCKKPLIISGGAGWCDMASRALINLSEKYDWPVISAFRRQDSFDNENPHYMGELTIAPAPHIHKMIDDADCIIAIGPRMGDITSGGYTRFSLPFMQQKFIHVFIDASEHYRAYYANISVASTPLNFINDLLNLPLGRGQWGNVIQQNHENYMDFVRSPLSHEKHMLANDVDMFAISAHLRDILPGDAIIAAGAGNYTKWAQRHHLYRHFRSEIACTNGSMGYGVPAGIAAKIAHPTKTVIAFAGDGCFLMTGQELATAVQHDIAIIILVINNGEYGTIRAHQEKHFPGRPIATKLLNPDFAAFAQSFGAFGARITKTDQFAPAFQQALKANKPAILNIIIG